MKYAFATAALLASQVLGHPLAVDLDKRQADIDITVLQFALTLEHLENVFYKQALTALSEQMFLDAGYSSKYYSDLKYIAHDEQAHVQLLTSAIKSAGATPVAACVYDFAFTDILSFITLSSVLEGVGTSAYLGGAPLITSKDYLTVAGSILVTEALHTSMQRGAIGEVPMANPYGTPLSPNPVYTLAAAFIVSCPASNPALPFKPFPTLSATNGMPGAGGMSYTFTAAASIPAGSYVTFVSGLNVVSVNATGTGGDTISAVIPDVAMGQTYVFVTNMDVEGSLMDSAILFGPAILEVTPPAPEIDFSQA